jgi:hypothetical protein
MNTASRPVALVPGSSGESDLEEPEVFFMPRQFRGSSDVKLDSRGMKKTPDHCRHL